MPGYEPKQSASVDADQAEYNAILNGIESLAISASNERWSGEILDEADSMQSPVAIPSWEKEDRGEEAIAGAALEVVSQRARLLGDDYPFSIDRSSLMYTNTEYGLYEYLLATSRAASLKERRFQQLLRQFERVAKELLIAYSGIHSKGARIGWPSEKDHSDGPSRFDRKVKWMKEKCGYDEQEWKFDLDNHYLTDTRKWAKDAKIDIVVRKSHNDSRPGGLTYLGQCGCGINDVDDSSSKHAELTEGWLNTFFSRPCLPPRIFVFLTSQHITQSSSIYLKQSNGQTLIMDRIRLMLMNRDYPCAIKKHEGYIQELSQRIFN